MTDIKCGFFLRRLSVTGASRPDATLDFIDGLNVVSGASDTGKSFALSCIDFAFGASQPPRKIAEMKGYNTVVLDLVSRVNGDQFAIERSLQGGDVSITQRDQAGTALDHFDVPFKHNASNKNTLSGFLLGLSGLWGRQVRKNAKGERRSLSFRDIAYLCVVDEERIISERPPHLSGIFTEKTVESEVFRMFVTGNESGEIIVGPSKKGNAAIDANLELIRVMIENGVNEFNKTGLEEDAIEKELAEIEEAREKAILEYDRVRVSVTELETSLSDHFRILREVQARRAVVEGLVKRFSLLDSHYDSDISRLDAIEETGTLLQALPSKFCPLCGAAPEDQRHDHSSEKYQISTVQMAARGEIEKISALRKDLSRVLEGLEIEDRQLQTKAGESAVSVNAVQLLIAEELMPRVKESAQALKQQNDRRDFLLRGQAAIERLLALRSNAVELEALRAASKSRSPKIAVTASSAEMEPFAEKVEEILKSWNYPNLGRVGFSENDQDLIIGGHPRSSHGKGVRALTCAAFILGLMKYCLDKKTAHPAMVVLDSPLVAYQEPDSSDGEILSLRQANVKEKFYASLAANFAEGQVIVFENEDPPNDLEQMFTKHHFSKTNADRYGFFPNS